MEARTFLVSATSDFATQVADDEFGTIFESYHSTIYAYVLRMVANADDAYDLTLDAFVKAYRAWPTRPLDLKVEPWLYRIATNTCLDEFRRRKIVRWTPLDVFNAVFHPKQVAPDNPERETVRNEEADLIRAALDRLPDKYRAALILREYQGMSGEQVASALGTTPGAAKVLLFRARERLRQEYLKLGGEPRE